MVFFLFVIVITSTIFVIILLINFSTIIIISRSPSAIIRIKPWDLSSYEWWISTRIPLSIRQILRISSFCLFIIISFIDLSRRTSWLTSRTLFNQILNFFIFAVSPWPVWIPARRIIGLPVHLNIFPVDFIRIKVIMMAIASFFQRPIIIFVLIVIIFILLSPSKIILINGTLRFYPTKLTASDVFGIIRELFIISPLMVSAPSQSFFLIFVPILVLTSDVLLLISWLILCPNYWSLLIFSRRVFGLRVFWFFLEQLLTWNLFGYWQRVYSLFSCNSS